MNGYVGGFNGQQVEVKADSLYAAKQKVVEHFKPSKKNMGLVWVVLAEMNGEPVVHVAVD
jgi:hypothetical protein